MNNDFLRVGATEESDGIVESGFTADKKAESADKSKTAVTPTGDNGGEKSIDVSHGKTDRIKLLISFLLFALATVMLSIVSFSTSDVKVYILAALFAACLIPIFSIALFTGLKINVKIGFSVSSAAFAIGSALYLVFYYAVKRLMPLIGGASWFKDINLTIIKDVLCFLIAFLFVKSIKKDSLFAAIILTLIIYCGYIITDNIFTVYGKNFIDVGVYNSSNYAGGMLDDGIYFEKISKTFVPVVFKYCVYETYIRVALAVINGFIIGIITAPVKDKTYNRRLLLLLFAVTLCVHVVVKFPSAILSVYIILGLLAVFISTALVIKVMNYAIGKAIRLSEAGK